ncbi:hypothetical protein B0J11DRAFT_510519 [Dendryphion nanum]|uniref:Uncharacterized protein n=1 Tax=Dendryphion nanum TaxID=256645 RepID=A0A9P9IDV1_9PLEO|nr:hypothetical protein B0J11DRAFT_510519 [Dendryphion nanum]
MSFLRQCLLLFLFVAFHLVLAAPPPTTGKIDEAVRVYHCPYNVKASLLSNMTSLDITYTTTDGQKTLFGPEKVTCYVKVSFRYGEDSDDQAGIQEINYKWSGAHTFGLIDTQIAWDDTWGPTKYRPVNFTGSPITTKNTTAMTLSSCAHTKKIYFHLGAELNVQTVFSASTAPADAQGTLTQSFKLWWLGACWAAESNHMCVWPDRNGELMNNEYCKQKKIRDGTKWFPGIGEDKDLRTAGFKEIAIPPHALASRTTICHLELGFLVCGKSSRNATLGVKRYQTT